MKSPAKLLALVSALSVVAATSAFADGTIQFGHDNPNYRSGSGGEFTVKVTNAGGDTDHIMDLYPTSGNATKVAWYNSSNVASGLGIETFCLQKTEYMNFNTTFWYSISDYAKGSTGYTPDHISRGTAYLFGLFAQGLLTDYTYAPGSGRAADAATLQHAIWYLEGEETLAAAGGSGVGGNKFLNDVITIYGSLTTAGYDSFANQGVEVLNLASSAANATAGNWDAQDQLIWPSVPDAATTVALLGVSLLGLAGFRRKFVK